MGVSGQTVTVSVDGNQVLAHTLPANTIPPSVLVGFTGGTGSRDDQHAVTTASISAGGNPLPPPRRLASALLIPQLRSGTHTVTVQVTSAGVLVVWLDGEQLLALPEPSLGPTSRLAFTGGTGGLTDVHVVRDVAISAG